MAGRRLLRFAQEGAWREDNRRHIGVSNGSITRADGVAYFDRRALP